jgi:hypothetical protein
MNPEGPPTPRLRWLSPQMPRKEPRAPRPQRASTPQCSEEPLAPRAQRTIGTSSLSPCRSAGPEHIRTERPERCPTRPSSKPLVRQDQRSSAPPARRASAYSNSKERVARSSRRGPPTPRAAASQPPSLERLRSRGSIDTLDPEARTPRAQSSWRLDLPTPRTTKSARRVSPSVPPSSSLEPVDDETPRHPDRSIRRPPDQSVPRPRPLEVRLPSAARARIVPHLRSEDLRQAQTRALATRSWSTLGARAHETPEHPEGHPTAPRTRMDPEDPRSEERRPAGSGAVPESDPKTTRGPAPGPSSSAARRPPKNPAQKGPLDTRCFKEPMSSPSSPAPTDPERLTRASRAALRTPLRRLGEP